MTCVAWDGHMMVGDRRSTTSLGTIGKVLKVHRIETRDRGPILVGISGSYQGSIAALNWLRGGDKPQSMDSVQLLLVDAKRQVFHMEDKLVWLPFKKGPNAVGSGRQVALAVMMVGGDALKAVKIASRLVCDVGDGFDMVRF